MTRMRKGQAPPQAAPVADLDSLLGEPSGGVQFSFDDLEGDALVALLSVAAKLDMLLTFYVARDSGDLCFSMRLGEKKRSYSAPDGDSFTQLIRGLTARLLGSLPPPGNYDPGPRTAP